MKNLAEENQMPGMKWGQKVVLTGWTGLPGEGGRVAHSHSCLPLLPQEPGIEAAVIPKSESFPEEQNQVMLPLKNESESFL